MRPPTLAAVEVLAQGKPHGSRIRYMAGCRCLPCRAANSSYETGRALRRRQGLWNGLVSALQSRRHILMLSRAGVGYKTVGLVAGISKTVMFKIRAGQQRQVRALTEKRILAVSREAARGSSLVPAGETWRKIRWLLDEGFTKGGIALRLGAKRPALQLNRNVVTATNAKKVEALYRSFQ